MNAWISYIFGIILFIFGLATLTSLWGIIFILIALPILYSSNTKMAKTSKKYRKLLNKVNKGATILAVVAGVTLIALLFYLSTRPF